MRLRLSTLFLTVFMGIFALSATAEVLHQTFEFSPAELKFSENNGFDQIYLPGGDLTDRVGWPQIPYRTFHLALPPGAVIQSVTIISSESRYLPGEYHLFPSQPPQILSIDERDIKFVSPDAGAYAAPTAYPGKLAEPAAAGGCVGYQVAGLNVFPLQYEPQNNRVRLYTRIEVSITYDTGGDQPLTSPRRDRQFDKVHDKLVRRLVTNPEQATAHTREPVLYKSALDPGDYEYLLITNSYYYSAFTPLIEWKTAKGVPATAVTTNWIYANYAGNDHAEQIRNFIKDAYQTWGVRWVLLGGDTWAVPHRTTWAMDVAYGGSFDENEVPTDMYYSDLDGSWDANMNGIYGEVDDDVDLYPEVFVGRATCDSYGEVETWVNKLITYEMNPPTDYQLNMAFYADVMWTNPYTDGGVAKNLIDELYVPARFDPIDKRYQTLGNESHASVIASLNQGQNMVNHNGHCWIDYMSVNTGGLSGYDMDNLTNGSRLSGFMFSIGCWPAAFDYDCVAEHFITNPNGGGVAFVGNSRYGWGSPGNPEYGYSDRYDQQFFKAILVDSIYNIGAALAKAKAVLAPNARQENVYRWCMYETNLLGDPEMPVWTDLPQHLFVGYPDTVPSAGGEYTITVATADTANPVAGAMVCLRKENDVYLRALTGPDGTASFTISPASDGLMSIIVTSQNFIPYQGEIVVGAGGTYIDYEDYTIDDVSGGNGDGILNPGENADLWLSIENHGPGAANSLAGSLIAHDDTYVTLVSGGLDFGDVPAGASAVSSTACALSVDPGCPDGHVALFDWTLTDVGAQTFTGVLAVQVKGSELVYYRYRIDDSAGDGNGRPDPGETCDLRVWVENSGLATAEAVTVAVWSVDPMVVVTGSPVSVGNIQSGDIAFADYLAEINPSCPSPYFVEMYVQAQTGSGEVFNDTLTFAIGPNGIFDDLESGAPGWTHGGTRDRWMLTDRRTHSGSSAWYCGNAGSWEYEDNMNCFLNIPEIVLGPNSRLTFWDWFLVPNYGVDGIHVLVADLDVGLYETIDFIGTGGALDSTLRTGNEWVRESYDLSAYPAGTRLSVRINFSSDNDNDIEEGFYIDDLRIESMPDYDVLIEPTHHLLRGGEGETVTRRLYIKNPGFWEDSYSLAITGGNWDATIWDADGTVELSEIGPVAPGATAVALLKVVVPPAGVGEADTSIVTATSISQSDRNAYTTTIITTEGARGTTPWLDMIGSTLNNSELWPLHSRAIVRSDITLVPSMPYIIDLYPGASLLSQKIDISGEADLILAFWYRAYRTSSSYSWYGSCNLTVEYYSDTGIWSQLTVRWGEGAEKSSFTELTYLLPGDAYHEDFRIRFRTNNNNAGHWYLDDIYLGPQRDYHFSYSTSPSPGYGATDEESVQYLYLMNLGLEPDEYDLLVADGDWTVTFWEDGSEITQTGTIPSGHSTTVMVKIAIPGGTPTQVADTTMITVTSNRGTEWRYAQFRTVCIGSVAGFPWVDDFPTSSLNVEKWPIPGGVSISSQTQAPSPPYTLRINVYDTAYSQLLDLSTTEDAMLDVYCRAGAIFELPTEDDNMFIEFRTELGEWEIIRSFNGGGRYKDEFDRYCDVLPPQALYRGCQLRIRGQLENNSWYLDNIKIVAPPSCLINPESVQRSINQGESANSTVSINDLGPGDLEYHVEIIPTNLLLANLLAHRESENVTAKTASAGNSLPGFEFLCDLGGPDDYGYIWIDSDEPYGPIFAWEDISGSGQQLMPLNSYLYDTLKLGFDFPYYGTTYTELLVSKYGALQFGPESGISQWGAIAIPYPIPPDNVLFWCWGNYHTLGTVYAHSTAERAIIQFENFGDGPGSPNTSATAQVELTADGRISYRYLNFGGGFPTKDCGVGLEDMSGTNGFGIVFYVNPLREDPHYLHDNLQIDFYPPPAWISVDPPSGMVTSGGTTPVDVEFTAGDLPFGNYDAVLRIATNDPDPAANPYYVTAWMTIIDTSLCYCPLGDTDMNGTIDPLDVAILVNYVYRQLGEPLYPPKCDYSTYDVIPDDTIDPLDVTYLVNYVYRGSLPPDNPCLW